MAKTLITPTRTITFNKVLNNLRIEKSASFFKRNTTWQIWVNSSEYSDGGGSQYPHCLHVASSQQEAEEIYNDLLIQMGLEPRSATGRLERIMKNIPATLAGPNQADRQIADLLRRYKRGDFDVRLQSDKSTTDAEEYEESPFHFEKS